MYPLPKVSATNLQYLYQGVFDNDTSLYTITQAQYDSLNDLVFNIGGVSFY